MLVNALVGILRRFAKGHREHVLQNGDEQGLRCVDAKISGLNVEALVESSVTHSFVSEQTTWGLHRKSECDGSSFKAVHLGVKPMVGVIHLVPLIVASWSRVLDMTVVPMDDHSVILSLDFLRHARVIPVLHEVCLLFQNRTETFGVPMMVRKKFGHVPSISSMTLFKVFEGDQPYIVAHLQEESDL